MADIPADLGPLAVRQYLAFVGGEAAFLDLVGDLFLDEGRVALRGRESVVRGFNDLLRRNREAAARPGAPPPPAVRVTGAEDLEGMRREAARPGGTSAGRALAAMLPDLAEGDILLRLEAASPGGRVERFFNIFRRDAAGWKVIAFGF